MSKWSEIRCDFYDEEEEKYFVDAWKTSNDNEEGEVIAKIDLANEAVEYLDNDAKYDEYAQEVIDEMLENGYVLTE
jgi:FMN-dependent NADH-azoreductase